MAKLPHIVQDPDATYHVPAFVHPQVGWALARVYRCNQGHTWVSKLHWMGRGSPPIPTMCPVCRNRSWDGSPDHPSIRFERSGR